MEQAPKAKPPDKQLDSQIKLAESDMAESAKNAKGTPEERYQIVNTILTKETFIDPLIPDQITKAYSVYERSQQKIIDVLVQSFQTYCRKCVRETALMEVKNELSHATIDEAEALKNEVVEKWNNKLRDDPALEQLLVMLLFKNYYWEWVRFGLKDIFSAQRMEPGHEINKYLNHRFHRYKKEKNFKTVGDLVMSDVTEIVNTFKGEIMSKKVRLF